jgi:hypothetical protein
LEFTDIGIDIEECLMRFVKTKWLFNKDTILLVQAFEMKAAIYDKAGCATNSSDIQFTRLRLCKAW